MPITYDPDTNTITIVGTKDGQPYTFEDIYQADVNNGWNKFTKLSEGVYKTTAKLCFGDGSTETWFEEKGTTLVIENTASKDWDTIITFKANCNATFGEAIEINGVKVVKNGVGFQFRETAYNQSTIDCTNDSNVVFYACKFKKLKDCKMCSVGGYVKSLEGCEFEIYVRNPQGSILANNIFVGEYGHISTPVNTQIYNNTFITTMDKAIFSTNATLEIKSIVTTTSDRLIDLYRLQSPNIVKLINCKAMNWKVNWYLESGDVSGELQRVYAVVFKVTDVNGNPLSGRTIKVYDKNGNLIVETTTDSNGLTPEVEILYAKLVNPYSDGQWHTFDEDDWEYFNPYVVEVWYGSELEYKGILTDLDVESTFIQITVKPSSFTINDLANKIEYVRKLFGNRWKIENNELKIYDDDNQTVIRRFKLYDKEGKPTETNVYDRVPV